MEDAGDGVERMDGLMRREEQRGESQGQQTDECRFKMAKEFDRVRGWVEVGM